MSRIIINTLNLRLGGAFQRSLSFIENLESIDEDIEVHIFCTQKYFDYLLLNDSKLNFHFFKYESNNFKFWFKTQKHFRRLERKIKPDLVFSFVGPAYIRPKTKHLVGFALPQIVYYDNPFVKNFNFRNKFLFRIKSIISKIEADYYVVQTQDVSSRLMDVFKINKDKVFMVSNGIGKQFQKFTPDENTIASRFRSRTLILISGYRDNKNFEIIPETLKILKNKNFKVQFLVTLEKADYKRLFQSYQELVMNVGKVSPKHIQKLYERSSALFIPSFLECFSASYCEAMHMSLPILASNYSFATTICSRSALYFNPFQPKKAAEQIIRLFTDYELYKELSGYSYSKKEDFPSSKEQALQYIKIINSIINEIPSNTNHFSS